MTRAFAALLVLIALTTTSFSQGWIRINQLGYLPTARKVAVFASKDSAASVRSFRIVDVLTRQEVWRSDRAAAFGPYGPFASTFRLDFSEVSTEGAYVLEAGGAVSPTFRIGWHVYNGTADFLLTYMRQQRCGFNPYLKDSCHTRDGYIIYHPTRDSSFLDVVGGWHDAADYLQYVTTSATAAFQMLMAYRDHPAAFTDTHDANGLPGPNGTADVVDEAEWGIRWLMKMNPAPGELYNQIADDRDHRGFRLPTEDTVDYGRGKERPVYFCTGEPQGIYTHKNRSTGLASTAGKFASVFAEAARLTAPLDPARSASLRSRAIDAYTAGLENPGVCQTAPCRAPYFYEEDNWVDDMELAAASLFTLTGEARYAADAARFGDSEPVTPWMGADRARHYQWYPFVNIGHALLAGLSDRTTAARFQSYLRRGIDSVYRRGKDNAFLFGVPFIWCSNNLVSSLLTQCLLYKRTTGDRTYEELESMLRDWLFGCNPWGTSMVVGLPSHGVSPRDPHSAFTHVYGYPIHGGLVDGPVYGSIFASLRGIQLTKEDAFAEFQSDLAVYHDDWGDYSTNEPTMDGTAGLTYPLSSFESEARASRPLRAGVLHYGGIVRMDTSTKTIYLAFTGHEFADGAASIRAALTKHRVPASFFFTGDFYRNPAFASAIRGLKADGHYLGAHSDRHLLYASWENRDSLLVSAEEFAVDLRENYRSMEPFGIKAAEARYFMPPYEWYNARVSAWCDSLGIKLVNFTPGTGTNADYTTPSMGGRYVPSDTLLARLFRLEARSPSGLNGAILLLHIGTAPERTDKFYKRLDRLIADLKRRGYAFAAFPRR